MAFIAIHLPGKPLDVYSKGYLCRFPEPRLNPSATKKDDRERRDKRRSVQLDVFRLIGEPLATWPRDSTWATCSTPGQMKLRDDPLALNSCGEPPESLKRGSGITTILVTESVLIAAHSVVSPWWPLETWRRCNPGIPPPFSGEGFPDSTPPTKNGGPPFCPEIHWASETALVQTSPWCPKSSCGVLGRDWDDVLFFLQISPFR